MAGDNGIVGRLKQVAEHDWRFSFLAHTSDTAREAAARIEELEGALRSESELVTLLRADLLKFLGSDPMSCEGCGAPIDYDEDVATTADIHGCWGYVADIKDTPCYRYRTEQGAERTWPPCDVSAHACALVRKDDRE